jgi:hypothetical protein
MTYQLTTQSPHSTHNHPKRFWEAPISDARLGFVGRSAGASEVESEEIARLFAAAPDLLAALERAVPALWLVATSGNADAVAIHDQAVNAIAKARGTA